MAYGGCGHCDGNFSFKNIKTIWTKSMSPKKVFPCKQVSNHQHKSPQSSKSWSWGWITIIHAHNISLNASLVNNVVLLSPNSTIININKTITTVSTHHNPVHQHQHHDHNLDKMGYWSIISASMALSPSPSTWPSKWSSWQQSPPGWLSTNYLRLNRPLHPVQVQEGARTWTRGWSQNEIDINSCMHSS